MELHLILANTAAKLASTTRPLTKVLKKISDECHRINKGFFWKFGIWRSEIFEIWESWNLGKLKSESLKFRNVEHFEK